jgi:hypothetical protein
VLDGFSGAQMGRYVQLRTPVRTPSGGECGVCQPLDIRHLRLNQKCILPLLNSSFVPDVFTQHKYHTENVNINRTTAAFPQSCDNFVPEAHFKT